jgi:hypothetical protein
MGLTVNWKRYFILDEGECCSKAQPLFPETRPGLTGRELQIVIFNNKINMLTYNLSLNILLTGNEAIAP